MQVTARGVCRLVLWQHMTWSYCLLRRYSMSQQKNSILINEDGLNREPVPLNKSPPHLMISLIHLLVGLVQLFGLYSAINSTGRHCTKNIKFFIFWSNLWRSPWIFQLPVFCQELTKIVGHTFGNKHVTHAYKSGKKTWHAMVLCNLYLTFHSIYFLNITNIYMLQIGLFMHVILQKISYSSRLPWYVLV